MATTTDTPTAFDLLREFLDDDRAAGIPWSDEDFAQRVQLACRLTRSSGSAEAIIGTAKVWRDAYNRVPAGALEQFGPSIGDSESSDRRDSVTLA